MLRFREAKRLQFQATGGDLQSEYLPWTAISGKAGLRDTLLHLINVTLKQGARSTGEPELRQRHYKQLVELIDFVLDARKSYLDSIAGTNPEKYSVQLQQFESQRTEMIYPFGKYLYLFFVHFIIKCILFSIPPPSVKDGQYELATKLAEKYLDFQCLVQICDRTDNQQRLDEYIGRYAEFGFSQFAINWHMRQNKRGDLFERFKHNQVELSRFLSDHPSLAWVQAVFNGDMAKASRVLLELASVETELIARKKTMLSLAKLTSFAMNDDDDVGGGGGGDMVQQQARLSHINSELHLIEFQESVPEHLMVAFGYDVEQPKVLKPEEIINVSRRICIYFYENNCDFFPITVINIGRERHSNGS